MDQFSAHLDRGWDLVQRGDTRGAEASARRALELDPNSPEAHNLLGYVAALEGDGEEAIENYRQAIALDDTYLEAMLNAAEVYIHPLGEYDQAIEMCDQALDLAEVDEEIIDALLLKFDALLAKGDTDEAARVVERIPNGPYDNPNHTFLVGRALYEIGQTERAARLVEEAAMKDPRHVEAYYYLGLVRDERGDMRGATQAFLHARELDIEMGLPPWAPGREAFAGLAQKAIAGLNPVLRRYVDGADVYVSDVPGMELVAEGVDPRALVLLDGLMSDDLSRGGRNDAPCARIFVYAINVARLAGSVEGIEREISLALEREITATFLEAEQAERPESELN
ncbi:tetratricopeptide repeat protein [Polyangium sp. y55x31]|uniref:tetratricopeptide repeat protein n=1 Tax=Polyangium sp. y55x31 TaxID=3042688 RepID=UPI002482C685|nr:tetratricopeptide repeat protein [Polyangium sp. y55x31]MDI1479015.1 tetratricopeptide repeat protein [Polyangium sp. y55x31]